MSLTDQELVALHQRYGHVLHRRCLAILGEPDLARDAVQETFARILVDPDAFRASPSPLTWMYRVSTAHCLGVLAARPAPEAPDAPPVPADPPGALDRQTVLRLLREVDEQTRACVLHTWFDACSRDEAAELLGVPAEDVSRRLEAFAERARASLVHLAAPALSLLLLITGGA